VPPTIRDIAPRVLPVGWRLTRDWPFGALHAYVYKHDRRGMMALLSVDDHGVDGLWAHLSISNQRGAHPVRWDWLREARDVFLGDVLCIQMLPPRKHWLNYESSTLHLFRRLDGPTIPEIYDRPDLEEAP